MASSIGRSAYNIAKQVASMVTENDNSKAEADEKKRTSREEEEELMGGTRSSKANGKGTASDIKERNLSQMVAVLHSRIGSMEKLAKIRFDLCAEDLMPNSALTSKNAPKISDDLDFLNDIHTRPGRDGTGGQRQHKDANLVTTEGVFIDPHNLVLRTKPPSETAKKLEAALEDIFGSTNTTRFKGRKKKGGLTGCAQKSLQQRYEAKKAMRVKLEKMLVTNMESFVTRSVLEPEVIFVSPLAIDEWPRWPISVRYSPADPLSSQTDNADGEMDPDLILRYALQRISLPSGEKMFRWLLKQPVVHHYFLFLFWLLKVKFFQQEGDMYNESYLLHHLSAKYAMVMEMLQGRTHIEYEKDIAYRSLPFILCNACYFGLVYVCPGSRHLYSKGFRRTLLMQIVNIMHGIQLCPVSVKVSWTNFFPDDAYDEEGDEGGAENAAESIPVSAALAASRNLALKKEESKKKLMTLNVQASSSDQQSGHVGHRGVLAGTEGRDMEQTRARTASASSAQGLHSNQSGTLGGVPDASLVESGALSRQSESAPAGSFQLKEEEVIDPLTRTFLTAPLRRPAKHVVSLRQNVETMDAKNISPMMQEFLGTKHSSTGFKQSLARTVPISWCPAGGVDTYRRRQVPKDLHDSISAKLAKSESDFVRVGLLGHRRKIAAAKLVEKTCTTILSGGQTRISQCVLDLIKRQRAGRDKKDKETAVPDEDIVPSGVDLFADGDLDEFLEGLE